MQRKRDFILVQVEGVGEILDVEPQVLVGAMHGKGFVMDVGGNPHLRHLLDDFVAEGFVFSIETHQIQMSARI